MFPRTPFHVHPYRGVERERFRDTGRDRWNGLERELERQVERLT